MSPCCRLDLICRHDTPASGPSGGRPDHLDAFEAALAEGSEAVLTPNIGGHGITEIMGHTIAERIAG
ncbi:hypothetical protein [Vreelandella rituensis]|uniref:hypothetical protein n=1 Tax=Vreelandella rituensis TaxID=2282306 RepID=UPI0011C0618F|nr:hypothetical protein [Halomonas rituensis]